MKTILLILSIAFAGIVNAQSPNWFWAKSAGGTADDRGYSCSTDASGNIIITGYFKSPTITFGTTTLTNASTGADIFIVKYGPAGNVLWAKREGGTSEDIGYSCSTDASGNIIITGYFYGTTITFGTYTLTNAFAGKADIFIVKYDPAGNVLWAKSGGGTFDDFAKSCSTDASGNIIITGGFKSPTISFGTYTLTNANNTGVYRDIFIVKYDPAGNVLWAKRAGGASDDEGNGCSTDASGNIIITGYFQSSPITFGTFTLTNADNTGATFDIFIVKYDPTGNVLWAKREGAWSDDVGQSCSTDASGNVIITGHFLTPAITFGTFTLTNAGSATDDIFIVKYGPAGNVLWAKRAGGINDDYVPSCSTDANGNIIITGFFNSSSITFGTTTLTNAGSEDIFIVKYDPAGNVLWAKSTGGPAADRGYGCSTDANGNIIITGYFISPTITFGTFTLTNAVNTSTTPDIFIAKLGNSLTSVNSLTMQDAITVFPNPSNGFFQVSSYMFQVKEIKIYNMLGEIIYQQANLPINSSSNFQIDLSAQPNGIYFIQINSDPSTSSGGSASKKLIINK